MAAGATATLTLRLRDLASSSLKGFGKTATNTISGIKKAGEQARKAFDVAGQLSLATSGMQQLQGTLDSVVQGPIEDFKEFQFQMEKVRQSTTVMDTDFATLTETAKQLGATTFFTSMQSAEGMEQLARGGFSASEQIDALLPTMRLAQATTSELGQTADIVTDLIGGLGLKAKDTGALANALASGTLNSSATLMDMFESMKLTGPMAASLNVPLAELTAITTVLAKSGLKASISGTALKGALKSLAVPTKKARTELKNLGLTGAALDDALESPGKLLLALSDSLEGMSGTQQLKQLSKIFEARQLPAIQTLVKAMVDAKAAGEDLGNVYETTLDNINTDIATNRIDRMGKAMEGTAKGQVAILDSEISALKVTIGEGLLPTQMSLMKTTKDMVGGLAAWTKENPSLTSAIGKLAVGLGGLLAIVIPLAFGVSSMITLWGLAGPFILAAAGWFGSLIASMASGAAVMVEFGVAFGGVVGVLGTMASGALLVAAGFAGWKFGTWLDEAVGWLFDLEGQAVSTYLALNTLSQSDFFNDVVGGVGSALSAVGFTETGQSLQDASRGNQARNETDQNFEQSLTGGPLGRSQVDKNFEQSLTGGLGRSQVDVNLKVDQDGRVKGAEVRTDDKKGPALNVGQVAAG